MASSKLDVINQALVRIGARRISSLSDQDAEALVAAEMYDTVVGNLMSETPWWFAIAGAQLAEIDTSSEPYVPFDRYDHVYQLPADYLRILGLESHMRFRLAGTRLYSNDDAPRLVYVKDLTDDPSKWPAYFTHLVTLELAGAFAISVTDTAARADIYQTAAAAYRRRAMGVDAQQTPPEIYELMQVYLKQSYNPLASA